MSEQKMSEICQTCKFWKCCEWQREGVHRLTEASCVFNAPVVRLVSEAHRGTGWPRTRGTDFCGQWQQCEEEK